MTSLYSKLRNFVLPAVITGATMGIMDLSSIDYAFADDNKPKEVIKQKEDIANINSTIPHYLENLVCPTDRVEKVLELDRISTTYSNHSTASNFINGNIRTEHELHGRKFTLYLHNYVQSKDKDGNEKIFHYDYAGKKEISKAQLAAVQNDLLTALSEAVDQAYDYHRGLQEHDRVITGIQDYLIARKAFPKEIKLKTLLDNPLAEDSSLTARDLLRIPKITKKGFVPKQFHYGRLGQYTLGITYLNTGVVGLGPLARQMDFVLGHPDVLAHELTHNNVELQGMPTAWEYDAEVHATMAMHPDLLHFLGHSYLKDIRKITRVLFNWDSNKVIDDLVEYRTQMGIKVNDDKLRTYFDRSDKIFNLIKENYIDFLIEFHTHRDYWIGVNKELGDDNAAFRTYMFLKFEPTLLDKIIEVEEDGKKVRKSDMATFKFIQEHRAVIKEAAEKAEERLENNNGRNSRRAHLKQIIDHYQSLDAVEQREILDFLNISGIEKSKDPSKALDNIERLIRAGIIKQPNRNFFRRGRK